MGKERLENLILTGHNEERNDGGKQRIIYFVSKWMAEQDLGQTTKSHPEGIRPSEEEHSPINSQSPQNWIVGFNGLYDFYTCIFLIKL